MLPNLKQARIQTGKSQEMVADELGVPLGTYRGWEQLKSTPRGRELKLLADYFDCSVDDLLGRNEHRLPIGASSPKPSPTYAPVYGCIPAGMPFDATEYREDDMWVHPDALAKHPRGFFLRVNGDSMNLVFPDGVYVYIDPDIKPESGDVGAVWVNGNEATVKRLHITPTSVTLLPESSNALNKPIVISVQEDGLTDVDPIGKVVWYSVRFDGRGL